MPTKQSEMEDLLSIAKDFNGIMDLYKRNEISHKEAIILGFTWLKFFHANYNKIHGGPHFDLAALDDAISKDNINSHRKILDKRFLEGCLIEGLTRFGAVREQVYVFMGNHFEIMRSACFASHEIFKCFFYEDKNEYSNDEFLFDCADWILGFVEKNYEPSQNSNKESIKTAVSAYERLIDSCKLTKESKDKERFRTYRYRPFEKTRPNVTIETIDETY